MREVRRIETIKVRNMCVKNDYYTRGTCEEYENMFNMCRVENATTDIIEGIAYDILVHSDIHDLKEKFGCLTCELVSNIMFELINDCTVTCTEQ